MQDQPSTLKPPVILSSECAKCGRRAQSPLADVGYYMLSYDGMNSPLSLDFSCNYCGVGWHRRVTVKVHDEDE